MNKDQSPIILAFSGGLDTSFCVPWLKEQYNREVITAYGLVHIDGFGLFFSIILLVIMILWRPSQNNQRYAFTQANPPTSHSHILQ